MRIGLGALVWDEGTGTYIDDGTGGSLPYYPPSTLCTTSDCLMTGAPLTPAQQAAQGVQGSSGSTSIASFLNSLTNAASAAVKAATTPAPYYIAGPNGQSVLYNPATGTVGQSVLTSLGGTSGGSSLMLLALAAVAIFALEKR